MWASIVRSCVAVDVFLSSVLDFSHRQVGAYCILGRQDWILLLFTLHWDDDVVFDHPTGVVDVLGSVATFAAKSLELVPGLELEYSSCFHSLPVMPQIFWGEAVLVALENSSA